MDIFKSLGKYEDITITHHKCKLSIFNAIPGKKIQPIGCIGSDELVPEGDPVLCITGKQSDLDLLYKDLLEETEDNPYVVVLDPNESIYVHYKDFQPGSITKSAKRNISLQ